MLAYLSLKKSKIFKIYIIAVILVSAVFISWQIIAEVEETPFVLKEYLSGKQCPNFTEINDLTMKDECTGLVWARRELPTYYGTPAELDAVSPPLEPGYSWDLAKLSCEEFVNVNGINMFRLPTVEELLTLIEYKCDANGCSSTLIRDLDRDGTDDLDAPYFARGNYWAINDFNEPVDWQSQSPERDYKRSVNLLTGEVDNPVYNKSMRLNAWCIVDRNSEITEMRFATANTTDLTNGGGSVIGQSVDSGNVRIVFHRQCGQSPNPDDDCTAVNGLCDTTQNLCYTEVPNVDATLLNPMTNLPYPIVVCLPGYHAEGDDCIPDCDPILGCWEGNDVNGYYSCPDLDEDGVADCDDNCPGIFNPAETAGVLAGLQGDADGDGIGDLCDNCYDYPPLSGNCVTLIAKQPPDNDDGTSPAGQWVQEFAPYGVAKSPQEFYCYNGNCTGYQTTYASSSNVVEYDIIYPNRSNIFAYISTDPDDNPDTDDVPEFSLGFIHDVPSGMNDEFPLASDTDGGKAVFTFSCPSTHANCNTIGNGYTASTVVAADDNLAEFSLPTTNWNWSYCCTDGGMLKVLPIDTGWCILIDPSFPSGINKLFLKEPGEAGYEVGYDVPNMSNPLEICYEPSF